MSATHTRTHTFVSFANPHLACDTCGKPVARWHDGSRCGCGRGTWNDPCDHQTGATSLCPSWSPVDGCRCTEPHTTTEGTTRC